MATKKKTARPAAKPVKPAKKSKSSRKKVVGPKPSPTPPKASPKSKKAAQPKPAHKAKKAVPAKRAAAPRRPVKMFAAAAEAVDQYLGHDRAVTIVTNCAGTDATTLPRTLAQLGRDGNAFQTCVFNGVNSAGFSIAFDNIPNNSSTTLISAVTVIQNASRKP